MAGGGERTCDNGQLAVLQGSFLDDVRSRARLLSMSDVVLLEPTLTVLPVYEAALHRGWFPHSIRGEDEAQEQLAAIQADPAAFVASLDDPDACGAPIRLPDGSEVPRLPGVTRWIWDGEFCGAIGLRWQKGTSALPPHVLGHIGYNVVSWKQGLGRAKLALAMMLPEARNRGLEHVELTSDPENFASHKVILANGGRLVEHFQKAPAYGGGEALRFRIDLPLPSP